MSVLDRLASALGRNDEQPNVALAQDLAATGDSAAIVELVGALSTGTAAIKSDAIKTLYEIGALRPELIVPHADAFMALLDSSSNRLVWGAMTALDAIAATQPGRVAADLPHILAAADRGSVIAKDRCIALLVKLAKAGDADSICPILLQRLADSAPNQFPSYAEAIAPVVPKPQRRNFIAILNERLTGMLQQAKRKRVEKLLQKFNG
jgi:hypothetical protein